MLRIAKFKLTEVNRNIKYGQMNIQNANAEKDEGNHDADKPPRSKSKNAQ